MVCTSSPLEIGVICQFSHCQEKEEKVGHGLMDVEDEPDVKEAKEAALARKKFKISAHESTATTVASSTKDDATYADVYD